MRYDPDLERLVDAVIDGLTVIHGWAALARLDPQDPTMQTRVLEIIQHTALESARHLRNYMSSPGMEGEPVQCP